MPADLQRSPLLMSAAQSLLLIVDAQEKLLALIPSRASLVWNLERLAAAAQVLDVPCLATEQYPEKLGPTHARLRPFVSPAGLANVSAEAIPAKLSFSCAGCREVRDQLQALGRRQVLLAGVETHVCIQQSAFDLLAAGYDVFLAVDAIGARFAIDHDVALRRMEVAGVTLTTTESALFEWCERAGTSEFKQISAIVRQPMPVN